MHPRSRDRLTAWLIVLYGVAYFIPFLGAVALFDWDEINFAESAREMLATGEFITVQIDYQPFREKPPLFFWLQALSMSLFGVGEFAARLPNAVFGIITLLLFFLLGHRLHGYRFGLLWSLGMAGSLLPALYFKSGIIDPVFNLFIFCGIVYLAAGVHRRHEPVSLRYAVSSGLFIGLATLTKGPVSLLIFLLTLSVYWFVSGRKQIFTWRHTTAFAVSYALVSGIWFALDMYRNGIGFLFEFIRYQWELLTLPVAGHSGPFYYHFVVVLLGCFPMSVFGLPLLLQRKPEPAPWDATRWMLILFWVVLILFSVVKTKILHYSSLTYFPLSYLAALSLNRMVEERRMAPGLRLLLLLIGLLLALMLFAAPWLAQHKHLLIPYLKDPFAADCLMTDVAWEGWEQYIGLAYLLLLMAALWLLYHRSIAMGAYLMYMSTSLVLLVYLKAVVPKIAQYSQGPAIAFYQSLQGKHVYITPYGFKSYAQYFYFRKPPGDPPESRDLQWLLNGPIDRPAYFVAKTTTADALKNQDGLQLLSQNGGFVFFVRQPSERQTPSASPEN